MPAQWKTYVTTAITVKTLEMYFSSLFNNNFSVNKTVSYGIAH